MNKFQEANGWHINWNQIPPNVEVYALALKDTNEIQGLAGIRNDADSCAAYLHWMCTAPHNNRHDFGKSWYSANDANDEERDELNAQAAAQDYLNTVAEKQSSITNITWIKIPDVNGDYYFFSCTVEFGDLKRKGTVTVEKKSDGTLKATGLEFDD